jgi:G3E family GTPase
MAFFASRSLFRFLVVPASLSFGLAAHRPTQIIPITVLSGFLGSGKTTLLQHLLHNQDGLRIAVVVNDVAEVNIDSRLISSSSLRSTSRAAGLVELQNGCACCSNSEELLASVAELVTLSDLRALDDDGSCFDHIVVEMSGVADPKSVRAKFQEALLYDMPLMERVRLDTMVTMVDCTTFLEHLQCTKMAQELEQKNEQTPELLMREIQEAWPSDLPAWLMDTIGPESSSSSSGKGDSVAELIVSQTETADLVLLNKVDLVDNDEITSRIQAIVQAVNPRALVLRTQFGEIAPDRVLAMAKGKGVVEAGIVDDHKDAIAAALASSSTLSSLDAEPATSESSKSHNQYTHNHSLVERASHEDSSCTDPDCSDHTHDHGHGHQHNHDHASSTASSSCDDPGCTDPSHDHSNTTTTSSHAGIGTFVYRARRPFHPKRLVSFLIHLPVSRGLPPAEGKQVIAVNHDTHATLQRVLRSKGFSWCADSHAAALYWSQAGSSFELGLLGSWWATLDRAQWPNEAVDTILQDFDNINHSDDMTCVSSSVGDRRQEIVFIGPTLGVRTNQELVRSALDQCLLTDAEWADYTEKQGSNPKLLSERFENPFESRVLSY